MPTKNTTGIETQLNNKKLVPKRLLSMWFMEFFMKGKILKKNFKNYGTLSAPIIFVENSNYMITSDQIKDLNSRLDILRQYL